jgi:hypothetical protein
MVMCGRLRFGARKTALRSRFSSARAVDFLAATVAACLLTLGAPVAAGTIEDDMNSLVEATR